MSLSGTYTLSICAGDLIAQALRAIKALASGETATAEEAEDARISLNMILKEWQSRGLFLWMTEDLTLFLAYDTASYLIGPSGTNCSATVVETEIATAASSGDGSVVVDSIAGMTDGDYVGVQLDDGTMQWTTINGTPLAATITLTDVLTDDAAADNIVVTYTTKTQRPVEITKVIRRDHDGLDVELTPLSRSEWSMIANKTSNGAPVQYYYDPLLTDGKLYVWPVPTDVTDHIIITHRRPIQTVENVVDDFEISQEWYRALKWELAAELASDYEVDLKTMSWIQAKADRHRSEAEWLDVDHGSFFLQPVMR